MLNLLQYYHGRTEGEVDGEHFWDTVSKRKIQYLILYHIPGFTTKIEGRKAYMDWFEWI